MKKNVMLILTISILIISSASLISAESNETEECTTDTECVSEERVYCEDSSACTETTDYNCVDGKCVSSTGTIGCQVCPEGCENGACIEGICRDENYECTIEDIPCCEGLKEISLSFPDSDGRCVGATCGSICRPCGNGVCDSNENICNCPEDCKTEAQCGEGIAECASEGRDYCQDSNACTETTEYKCIDGECVSVGGGSGCTPCTYGCENGACLSRPEPEPEPEPRPDICAARITISFDKNVYYIGEDLKVVMEIFDAQGNHLPHYPFYIKVYDYEKGIWHPSPQRDRTDGSGYKIHQDKMKTGEPFRFGKNKLKIYTDIGECNLVESIVIIEIKRKKEPKPIPCGMGRCVPELEPIDVEPTDIPDEKGFYSCPGCELEDKCYPMGYRKKGEYCSDNNEFIDQSKTGTCDNNFECTSNLCIGGECITEGFIRKIIDWLKAFFGIRPEPPTEKACSKLLLEHSIGEYKYEKSMYGENEHMHAPLFSEDGEHLDTIKCCAAMYKDKEDTAHGVLFCPYDSKEDVTNSIKWIIAKERNIIFKEFRNEKVVGDDKGQAIIWTNNAYLIAVGPGAEEGVPLPEDLAEAYLKKYPSEFELTEDDIPDAPPERPWVYCTEEDEKKGNKCESQPGARLQTDPNPENKSCEIYVGCILPYEKCESIDDIKEKEDCYVGVAERTGDSSVCKEIISDERRRNKCYVKAAETSKDASICEKITDEEIKKMCFELVEVFPWESCKSDEDMLKEECHFIDDFESGLENWIFHGDEGYESTEVINGNTVLKLTGVIQPDLQRVWDNYLFKFRFKRIEGSVHVNFRKTSPPGGQRRYIVAMSRGVDNLNKHVNEDWPRLDDTHFEFDENWHTLEIKGYDNILNVYLDDELIYKYKDTESPLLYGMPGFEIHTGGRPITPEFLIDDVEVKLITEEDIIYP